MIFYKEIIILFSVVFGTQIVHADQRIRKAAGNVLGSANSYGEFATWYTFREGFEISLGEVNVPLRMLFSGVERYHSGSVIGRGGWIPMFESTIMELDENTVRLTTIGGHSVILRKFADSFISANDQWKGTLEGNELFKVGGPDGLVMLFDGGRLREISIENLFLEWIYRSDKIEIYSDGNKFVSAMLGDGGLVDEIKYSNGSSISLRYSPYPIFLTDGVNTVIGGLDSFMSGLNSSCGYTGDIEIGYDLELSRMNYALKDSNGGGGLSATWEIFSGEIVSDGEWAYTISEPVEGGRYPKIQRSRAGDLEFYHFDTSKMMISRKQTGRTETRRYYIGARNPSYMKLRKVELFDPKTDAFIDHLVKFYDENGRLRRKITSDKEYIYDFFEGGAPKSELVRCLNEGGILRQRQFHLDGRIDSSTLRDGLKQLWNYSADGQLESVTIEGHSE